MANNHSDTEKRLREATDEFQANSDLKSSEYAVPALGQAFPRYTDHRFTIVEKMEHRQLHSSRRRRFLSTGRGARGYRSVWPIARLPLVWCGSLPGRRCGFPSRLVHVWNLVAMTIAVACLHGCGPGDAPVEPTVNEETVVEEVVLSESIGMAVAKTLTEALRPESYPRARSQPVIMAPPSPGLVEAISSEVGNVGFLVVAIDSVAYESGTILPGNLSYSILKPASLGAGVSEELHRAPRQRNSPAGDALIARRAEEFLGFLESIEIDAGPYRDLFDHTEFHDAAEFPGGMPSRSARYAFWPGSQSLRTMSMFRRRVFISWDGMNRCIFLPAETDSIRSDDSFITDPEPRFSYSAIFLNAAAVHGKFLVGCVANRQPRSNDQILGSHLAEMGVQYMRMMTLRFLEAEVTGSDVRHVALGCDDALDLGIDDCFGLFSLPSAETAVAVSVPEEVIRGEAFTARAHFEDPVNGHLFRYFEYKIRIENEDGTGLGSDRGVLGSDDTTVEVVAPSAGDRIRFTFETCGGDAYGVTRIIEAP